MAIGVDGIVIYDRVIAANDPSTACKFTGRNFHKVNGRTVCVLCEGVIVCRSIHDRELTALEGKAFGFRYAGANHCVIRAPNGILIQVCAVGLADHNTCIGNAIGTCSVVNGNLPCGRLCIILIYFKEYGLVIFIVNDKALIDLGHSANYNLTVVIKANAVLVGHIALCNHDAVIYIGLYIGTGVIEIVAIGSKHDLTACFCFVVLGDIHNSLQCGSGSISYAVDHPFVLGIFCRGVIFTVENILLGTVFCCGFFHIVDAVCVKLILRIAQHIGGKCRNSNCHKQYKRNCQ